MLLHTLCLLVIALAAMASPGAGAVTLYGTGYARVGVPDMAQAVTFFQDVLDCRPIDTDVTRKSASSVLLSCDTGSIVELFDNRGVPAASAKPDQPLRFVADDLRHGGDWLRREGVTVNGSPHRLTSGPLAGRMVLDFLAPWGMPLQLLDNHADSAADGVLATAAD
jgi:catechol 2,3-dioxygenase-like lactoylglutathione lyase family enzyme